MFRKKKAEPSVITRAGEIFKEQLAKGDEFYRLTEAGAIAWRHEEVECQVVLPTPETSGIGLFQAVQQVESDDEVQQIRRYFFTETGLLRATTVLLTREELDAIDEDMFTELETLSDTGSISEEDMDSFFMLFFSAIRPGSSE